MNAAALKRIVSEQSKRTGVGAKLILAVIKAESGGDPSAVSAAGAQGIMQLMPETSLTYGVQNPFDPAENISGGARYLRDLLAHYHRNVRLAVAAYNAGPGVVDKAKGIPNILETKAYVAHVVSVLHTL
jgi:soluble lytic murein transglycosylase-like protein